MKVNKVISSKNLPSKLPLWTTIVAYLLMDKTNPPQWVWGAVGLFFLVMWIAAIVSVVQQIEIDIMKIHFPGDKNSDDK